MGIVAITEEQRSKAEIYHGEQLGREKTALLLRELGLPNGLLPAKGILECGYVADTGLVWMKLKHGVEHRFHKVHRTVSFAPLVVAYVEKGHVRIVTGIKAKELFLWVSVDDIVIDGPPDTGKLTCTAAIAGIRRVFPAAAFHIEDDVVNVDGVNKKG